MSHPKILAFAGSARKESFNKKLVSIAASVARDEGAEVTNVDLRDYAMPLYDGDLEDSNGIPENADKLYEMFKTHDGLLIASPEYNSSISALLKNTIDWVSRPRKDEPRLAAFIGKTAGIMSASPGQLGGLRGLVHVKAILGNIGVLVIPDQVAISNAHEMFADDGTLNDDKMQGRVTNMVKSLVHNTKRQIST